MGLLALLLFAGDESAAVGCLQNRSKQGYSKMLKAMRDPRTHAINVAAVLGTNLMCGNSPHVRRVVCNDAAGFRQAL